MSDWVSIPFFEKNYHRPEDLKEIDGVLYRRRDAGRDQEAMRRLFTEQRDYLRSCLKLAESRLAKVERGDLDSIGTDWEGQE